MQITENQRDNPGHLCMSIVDIATNIHNGYRSVILIQYACGALQSTNISNLCIVLHAVLVSFFRCHSDISIANRHSFG